MSNDQIDFDESFVKVDFELMREKRNTELATIKEGWEVANDNQLFSLPLIESNINDKSRINIKDSNISIMESAEGYYLKNNLTNKRTRYFNSVDEINETLINSTY